MLEGVLLGVLWFDLNWNHESSQSRWFTSNRQV